MTETEMMDLCRKIYCKPDEYAKTVDYWVNVACDEYARLIKKGHEHYCVAWRVNAMIADIEKQNQIKLMMRFE